MNTFAQYFSVLYLWFLCLPFFFESSASALMLRPSVSPQVLLIGDSHVSGSFGANLHRLFAARGFAMASYGLVGSNPTHWVNRNDSQRDQLMRRDFTRRPDTAGNIATDPIAIPPAQALLTGLAQQHRPQILVAEFGDNFANYAGGRVIPSLVNQQVQSLLAGVSATMGIRTEYCFFITPTYGEERPVNGIYYQKTHRQLALSKVKEYPKYEYV